MPGKPKHSESSALDVAELSWNLPVQLIYFSLEAFIVIQMANSLELTEVNSSRF